MFKWNLFFPGHNYLGLGNSVESGEPVDEDDYIAMEHDFEYTLANNNTDIRRADKKALTAFLSLRTWHGYVAALILWCKIQLEIQLSRCVYPTHFNWSLQEIEMAKQYKYLYDHFKNNLLYQTRYTTFSNFKNSLEAKNLLNKKLSTVQKLHFDILL